MKRKYDVEVVRETYVYVIVEVDEEIPSFSTDFDLLAIAKAEEIPDNEWGQRRDLYIDAVIDMTGKR